MENNLPGKSPQGPRPGGTEPVAPISKARASVLERLRGAAAPLSVDALAAATGQHANTVREHLEALVAAGLATRTTAARAGRGRPAWLYAPALPDAAPAGYAALAGVLAAHIAATSTSPAADGEQAGRQWADALRGARPLPGVAPAARRPRAVRLQVAEHLRQAGFGVDANPAATELALTVCPILAAARNNPDVVCAVHLGLVRGLLEGTGLPAEGVRLVPFARPGSCALHLPATAAS
ncbi:helix-turn-helix transcriptional regulator [Specibacter cremeus]|uniref:helix-turn-helix transcriptional regulator n=1 Tax=Specibacter cremeus TaxID=1629051 RepID=UPI00197B74A7|nr:helix-turn-helix domain-containing protein [Specibacter cremeus]